MRIKPPASIVPDATELNVQFQGSPESQELRVVVRVADPQDDLVAWWRLDRGVIGGAEYAPWLTDWQFDWSRSLPPSKLPSRKGPQEVTYFATVTGCSHRFIPHLVGRIALNLDLFGKPRATPTFIEVVGSLPLVNDASVRTENVRGMLANRSFYPGQWPDLGFPVEQVAFVEHELGVQIEMVEPLGDAQADLLKQHLIDMASSFESFPSETGKAIDHAKAKRKGFPPTVEGVMVQGYIGELLQDHAPCQAAVLNMLCKLHRQSPILSVRMTSRVGATQSPRGKTKPVTKQNWFTWRLAGTMSGRALNPLAIAKSPGAKAASIAAAGTTERPSALLLQDVPDKVDHAFDRDGLLASEADVPSLYAVLRADIYLEPVTDADAEPLRQAGIQLASLFGDKLHFTLNWNRNSLHPRVVRYQAKHVNHFADAIGVLTGTKYGDKFNRMVAMGEFHHEVDIALKGNWPPGGVKETDAASPWGLLFQGEISDALVNNTLPAPAVLSWSVPASFDLPKFAESVTAVASGLRVSWGVAGYGYASWDYTTPGLRRPRNHLPALFAHAKAHSGFDVGLHYGYLQELRECIRTVNWLTLIGPRLRPQIEGHTQDGIELHRTKAFALLRASKGPLRGVDESERAAYAAVDALVRPIRLSRGIEGNALRRACGGYFKSAEAEVWLRRFER
jgi:hypothetical protein